MTEHIDFGVTFGKATAPFIYGQRKAVDDFRRQQLDQARSERAAELWEQNRKDREKWIEGIGDNKQYLSGDPNMDIGILKAKNTMISEINADLEKNPNIGTGELRSKYQPKINDLFQYQQRAKQFDANLNAVADEFKGVKGVNAAKMKDIVKQYSLQKAEGINDIPTDVEQIRSIALKHVGDIVETDEGVSEFLKSQPKVAMGKMIKTRNSAGTTSTKEVKENLPAYAMIDDDGKADVKHEVFEINKPISKIQTTVDGRMLDKDEKAEAQVYLTEVLASDGKIKMLDEETFEQFMQDKRFGMALDAATEAYIDDYEADSKGQRKFPRGTVTETMLKRAIAYKKASQYLEGQVVDKNTQMQVVVKNSGSGGSAAKEDKEEPVVLDLFGNVKKITQNDKNQYRPLSFKGWGASEKEQLLKVARGIRADPELRDENLAVFTGADGVMRLWLYDPKKKRGVQELFVIDENIMNGSVQPGIKSKQAVVKSVNKGATKKKAY